MTVYLDDGDQRDPKCTCWRSVPEPELADTPHTPEIRCPIHGRDGGWGGDDEWARF